jgi:competence protein ComEA
MVERSAPAAVPRRLPAPLNINAAGAEALQALPGIGPALAVRIVADREARGPFRTPEDLRRVPGIGPKRWERIRPLVRLAEEP